MLADDATSSFPGVIRAWEKAKTQGWLKEIECLPNVLVVDGYVKGWCFGEFTRDWSETDQ